MIFILSDGERTSVSISNAHRERYIATFYGTQQLFRWHLNAAAMRRKYNLVAHGARSAMGRKELHYPDVILRHEATSGALREVTLLPECDGTINGTAILWTTEFVNWLATEDTELQKCVGLVVSLKLGIMVSAFHDDDESQKAIHAFRKGDLDVLADKMRSFFGEKRNFNYTVRSFKQASASGRNPSVK